MLQTLTDVYMIVCSFCDLLWQINGRKFAGERRAGIVIALKRNGAYADDIQVQQLGLRRVV